MDKVKVVGIKDTEDYIKVKNEVSNPVGLEGEKLDGIGATHWTYRPAQFMDVITKLEGLISGAEGQERLDLVAARGMVSNCFDKYTREYMKGES